MKNLILLITISLFIIACEKNDVSIKDTSVEFIPEKTLKDVIPGEWTTTSWTYYESEYDRTTKYTCGYFYYEGTKDTSDEYFIFYNDQRLILSHLNLEHGYNDLVSEGEWFLSTKNISLSYHIALKEKTSRPEIISYTDNTMTWRLLPSIGDTVLIYLNKQ